MGIVVVENTAAEVVVCRRELDIEYHKNQAVVEVVVEDTAAEVVVVYHRVFDIEHHKNQAVVEVVDRDKEGGRVTVVAGYGEQTQWYQNLRAHPEILIQIGRKKLPVTARFVSAQDGGNPKALHPGYPESCQM